MSPFIFFSKFFQMLIIKSRHFSVGLRNHQDLEPEISTILFRRIFSQSSPFLIHSNLVGSSKSFWIFSGIANGAPAASQASGNFAGDAVAKQIRNNLKFAPVLNPPKLCWLRFCDFLIAPPSALPTSHYCRLVNRRTAVSKGQSYLAYGSPNPGIN